MKQKKTTVTTRSKVPEKLKCWEVFQCDEKDCPAFKKQDMRCWLKSGTHCRSEMQGKFLEKMELCLACMVFKTNMDIAAMNKTLKAVNTQLEEYKKMVVSRDRKMESMSIELAIGLSEVFEGLRKISQGDPTIRINEASKVELIKKLKHIVNLTAKDIGEIVDQSHEFAMVLAEHFDVLHKVSTGDLTARVSGKSKIELLEALKNVTNEMVDNIDKEITERKQMEVALRESEKKYLDLYQNAPDGYHSLGLDGTIFEVNDTWLRMLGYERDEVVGKMKLTDLLTEKGREIFRKTFPELKQKGSIENIDYSFKRKDGRLLPVVINATAVYDDKRLFLRSRTIVRDNSEKKSYEKMLERASREWRSTFDSMPYGAMLLDKDLNIMRANVYISGIFNIPIHELTGVNCCALSFGSNSPAEFCHTLKAKDTLITETLEFHDTKLNRYFMMQGTPVLDDEGLIRAFVLSLIDISELKEKEQRLIESKDAFFNMLKELDVSYKELKGLYESLIHSFVNAIDAKSPWTKGHSERVTNYAVSIAKEMGLGEKEIETLRIAALLHDIGKIGTYDVILEKPGKLSDEEFALIRLHPVRGEEILKPIKQFEELLPIVRHHHERMDGRGYPDGLLNGQIPFLSKIICIADSYDSMTSDRPYRPAPPSEYAISELKRCKGTQFEPQAVEAFLRFLEKANN